MSRFFVTGATGFIGSAVVRCLERSGHHVIAPSSSELDLLAASQATLSAAAERFGATHCIHCAWYTNHADYLTHQVNREWLAASQRLAQACAGMRFIGLGTCLEYDLSVAKPRAEDETSLAPETLYAASKRDLFQSLNGNFAWVRIFFVYGPGDRAGRLIPHMVEQFSKGEASGPTYGGLRRDYIHVDDLAGQIVRIATSDVVGAINTGTGTAPTLSEIFAAGAEALGRPECARSNAETGGQPLLIQPDLARFGREIGEPEARDIRLGLRDLVG